MQRRAFRPVAPNPAALIRWPEAFGTRFTLFVDVEEEFDWRVPLDRTQRSTGAMAAFPAAHRRLSDLGIALGCLVDHPIVSDPRSVAILLRVIEDGRSEIGTQLHPWVNPPDLGDAIEGNGFAGLLPPAMEAAKIDGLTDAISAAFGRRPRVYRAGRYGIGPHTAGLLVERGYRVDSSMRARYDYSAIGGPDFSAIGAHAFRLGDLVELPLTTMFVGAWRAGSAALYRRLGTVPKLRGFAARTGLLSRVALTPEDMPIGDAIRAVDAALADGVRVLNFGFHSPSLMPGHTPYVRDAADLDRFWRWWEAMSKHLHRAGVTNASIGELIEAAG